MTKEPVINSRIVVWMEFDSTFIHLNESAQKTLLCGLEISKKRNREVREVILLSTRDFVVIKDTIVDLLIKETIDIVLAVNTDFFSPKEQERFMRLAAELDMTRVGLILYPGKEIKKALRRIELERIIRRPPYLEAN